MSKYYVHGLSELAVVACVYVLRMGESGNVGHTYGIEMQSAA